jgi:hypothetical protein
MVRRIAALPLALAAALVLSASALAGGMAIANLDSTPTEPRVGEATTLGFTVLQHGVTPVTDGVGIVARNDATGEKITGTVRHEGKPGHYIATLTFPSAGTWSWEITTEGLLMQSKFPPLTVLPAAAAPAPSAPAGMPVQAIGGALALAVIVLGAAYLFLRRRPAVVGGGATELG